MVDSRSYGEINLYHQLLDVTRFAGGRDHILDVQTVRKGLFGTHLPEPVFKAAELLTVDESVSGAYLDFMVAIDVFEATKDDLLAEKLLRIISDCLSEIKLPRSTKQYFKTAPDNPTLYGQQQYGSVNHLWHSPDFEKSSGNELPEKYKATVMNARNTLNDSIVKLREEHGSVGSVQIAGQAHIDYA